MKGFINILRASMFPEHFSMLIFCYVKAVHLKIDSINISMLMHELEVNTLT